MFLVFYIHITSIIIWFCTSIHVSPSRAEWRFTKHNWRRQFNTYLQHWKMHQDLLNKPKCVDESEKKVGVWPGKWWLFLVDCFDSSTQTAVKLTNFVPPFSHPSFPVHITCFLLIKHTNSHAYTCECYKCGERRGGKQEKAVIWPQFHCQAAGLVNVKQQDGAPYEAR